MVDKYKEKHPGHSTWHGLWQIVKMFDLAWYLEWEEGEGAPTWGKMCDFIDVT
eukprot:SAG31_NODE_1928_length_6883_cov_6.045106_11_plen_52_part_01